MYICPTPSSFTSLSFPQPPSWYSFFFLSPGFPQSYSCSMGISTLKWHIEHSPTRRYTVCLLHRQGNTIPYSVLALNLFQKFFRKKPVRDLLPTKPAVLKVLEPWWIVQIGYVTEDDIRVRRKRSFQYNCTLGKIGLLENCYKFVIFV